MVTLSPPSRRRGRHLEAAAAPRSSFLSAMKRFSSIRNWETSPVGIFAPAVGMEIPTAGADFF